VLADRQAVTMRALAAAAFVVLRLRGCSPAEGQDCFVI
jgi:hypothetical protein